MNQRHWICLLAFLLILSLVLLLFLYGRPSAHDLFAEIYQDGILQTTVHLETLSEPVRIPLKSERGENVILAEPGRILMQSANCPDQLCVHQGAIADATVPIVCLPHRVVIQIVSADATKTDSISQ